MSTQQLKIPFGLHAAWEHSKTFSFYWYVLNTEGAGTGLSVQEKKNHTGKKKAKIPKYLCAKTDLKCARDKEKK